MAKDELVRGATYRVRLTDGHWTNATFIHAVKRGGGSWGREMTHWVFQNQATGRDVEIKSRVRIKEAKDINAPSVPTGFNPARN